MDSTKRLWTLLAVLLIVSFSVLLWSGNQIYQKAPPMPEQVVSANGDVIYTRADIEKGRRVWQSMGGMQLGSIWGHGGYVAPDWTADWLHRELVTLLDIWAQREFGATIFTQLSNEQQASLQSRLRAVMRTNTYEPASGTITVSADRAAAMAAVSAHYQSLFGNDSQTFELREAYAMKNDTVPDPAHRRVLSAFFWWTAWAAVTERPGSSITYTNNWPSEPLVDNRPPPSTFLWSARRYDFRLRRTGAGSLHCRTVALPPSFGCTKENARRRERGRWRAFTAALFRRIPTASSWTNITTLKPGALFPCAAIPGACSTTAGSGNISNSSATSAGRSET